MDRHLCVPISGCITTATQNLSQFNKPQYRVYLLNCRDTALLYTKGTFHPAQSCLPRQRCREVLVICLYVLLYLILSPAQGCFKQVLMHHAQ